MEFQIKVADKIFQIQSLFLKDSYFKDYLVQSEQSDYSISIEKKDLILEKNIARYVDDDGNCYARNFSAEEYETVAIQRKISNLLFFEDVIMLHGVLLAIGNDGYILTAKSGVGKTTRALKWLENIPGSYIVNGDKPFLSIGEEVIAYGTPWCGKEGINKNTSVTLKGVCFISRSDDYSIEELNISKAFSRLVSQVHVPDSKETIKLIQLLNTMSKSVKFYDLQCDISDESAIKTYEYVSKNK
ncbi:MAG: hypothetical protein Q4C49_11165 [Bacillota bacterium]|nr:hypothetical protein [Bacillota bacterium]